VMCVCVVCVCVCVCVWCVVCVCRVSCVCVFVCVCEAIRRTFKTSNNYKLLEQQNIISVQPSFKGVRIQPERKTA